MYVTHTKISIHTTGLINVVTKPPAQVLLGRAFLTLSFKGMVGVFIYESYYRRLQYNFMWPHLYFMGVVFILSSPVLADRGCRP